MNKKISIMKKIRSTISISILALTAWVILNGCHGQNQSSTTGNTETDTTAMNNTMNNPSTKTVPDTGTLSNVNVNANGTMTDTTSHTGRIAHTPHVKPHITTSATPAVDRSVKMQTDTKGYYNYTESAPVYSGGQAAIESYLNDHLEYPDEALDNNVEGTVMVKFTVDENGKVGNVQTTGPQLGYGLDEAAMKAVASMPKWTPGMVNGKRVKTWFNIPLTFKIQE